MIVDCGVWKEGEVRYVWIFVCVFRSYEEFYDV